MIEVELPDGTIAEFPDGTGNDVIKGALQKRFAAPQQASPQQPKAEFAGGMAGAGALGAADTMSFGFGDELGAGLGSTSEYLASLITGEKPRSYDELLGKMRDQENRAKETNPGSFLTGQIAGGLTGGAGLAKGGLSLTANAIKAGKGLGGISLASLKEGAALGGLQGFGSGEGVEDRLYKTGLGAGVGSALGGAMPAAMSTVGGLVRGATRPFAAMVRPEKAAENALSTYLKRSGMSADDIASSLQGARADGQDMFTVADAMGHAGQRALVPAVRTPNDARQEIVNQLLGRQSGQGDRLSSFLAEGFAAPDTAAQRATRLASERTSTANANYGAARNSAGVVDPTDAIAAADDFLTPGATQLMNPGNNIADDSIEAAVRKARGYLTDGNSVLTDFSAALRSKQEIDAMIDGAKPAVQRMLIPIRNKLDSALEGASPDYAAARNAFRQQSKAIDAVDTGRTAASGRVRADDSIPAFGNMSPEEQAAFRAGYVDPLISRVESASMSPSTNKARPLVTEKTRQEFPAFAAPGEADRLGNRISREQTMFETGNAALGNSKTADNFADMDDAKNFDPAILSNLMSGNWPGAAMSGARQALNFGKGLPPRAVERIGRSMMETNPDVARQMFGGLQQRQMSQDQIKALILSGLLGNTSAGAGRITSP